MRLCHGRGRGGSRSTARRSASSVSITPTARRRFGRKQHLAAFMAVASEPLQRALVLALETGQRQGDLLTLPWSAYDGTWIRLRQSQDRTPRQHPGHPPPAGRAREHASAPRPSSSPTNAAWRGSPTPSASSGATPAARPRSSALRFTICAERPSRGLPRRNARHAEIASHHRPLDAGRGRDPRHVPRAHRQDCVGGHRQTRKGQGVNANDKMTYKMPDGIPAKYWRPRPELKQGRRSGCPAAHPSAARCSPPARAVCRF